jgi:hypothetical protein
MADMEAVYQERLKRYTTALFNGRPDRVPIRPFAAEFTGVYAGFTAQELTHDFNNAFEAVCRCAKDFDWDATVGNMVYVWTGLTEAIGLKYYGVPGIDVPPDTGFQYREPEDEAAFMKADEYDALIADPTGYLFETWLPRVSRAIETPGAPASFKHNMAFLKGGMAMMSYFDAFPAQGERMRRECGTPGAIAGIFKAPLDILGDKLRGYIGLTMDLLTQPDKVLKACEALMPHLCAVAVSGADPEKNVPIGFWMHRGCTPFVTMDQFSQYYWPTLKPIIEEIWKAGHQTLFYAEGDWNAHLDAFRDLPDQSIVYHVDKADIFYAKRKLGDKFCISGGVPNTLLSYGTPEEVRARCRKLCEEAGADGGYVMDANAIIQNDAKVENVKAMTDATREFGVYSQAPSPPPEPADTAALGGLKNFESKSGRLPMVCTPFEEYEKERGPFEHNPDLIQNIYANTEALGYLFIWHCLLSF